MTSKFCKNCNETKNIADFYKNKSQKDGLQWECKKCTLIFVRRYKARHPERIIQKRIETFEKRKKWMDDWRSRNKEKYVLYSQRTQEKYKEKRLAVRKLNLAVKHEKINRPKKCSSCGNSGRIEGHHEDYNKPLSVIWLCKKCHMLTHNPELILE